MVPKVFCKHKGMNCYKISSNGDFGCGSMRRTAIHMLGIAVFSAETQLLDSAEQQQIMLEYRKQGDI